MARTVTVPVILYSDQTGLALKAQPKTAVYASTGAAIATGFAEAGNGQYAWTGSIPDDARFVAFLLAADDTFLALEPVPDVQLGEAVTVSGNVTVGAYAAGQDPAALLDTRFDAVDSALAGVSTFDPATDEVLVATLPDPAPAGYGANIEIFGEDGAIEYRYTVFDVDGTTPLPNVLVYVSADIAGTQRSQTKVTDALGQVVFRLNPATVYLWRSHPQRTFLNPDSEVVS
jgi:hypothetical protein